MMPRRGIESISSLVVQYPLPWTVYTFAFYAFFLFPIDATVVGDLVSIYEWWRNPKILSFLFRPDYFAFVRLGNLTMQLQSADWQY
jgi:hypothetical protein